MNRDYFRKKETVGRLRHRVQFWQPIYTANAYGEQEKSYTALDPVWANVEYLPSGSGEDSEAQRITSMVNCRVIIRFNSLINAEWRMVHNNEQFNVLTVLPDAKQQYMMLECVIDEPVTSY